MIMRKEDILSKGTYVHSQVADLVCVKQYIIAKFKNKKALFLRFSNDREELATAMECRCYRGDVNRTKFVELKYKGRDYAWLILMLVLFVGIILLRILPYKLEIDSILYDIVFYKI